MYENLMTREDLYKSVKKDESVLTRDEVIAIIEDYLYKKDVEEEWQDPQGLADMANSPPRYPVMEAWIASISGDYKTAQVTIPYHLGESGETLTAIVSAELTAWCIAWEKPAEYYSTIKESPIWGKLSVNGNDFQTTVPTIQLSTSVVTGAGVLTPPLATCVVSGSASPTPPITKVDPASYKFTGDYDKMGSTIQTDQDKFQLISHLHSRENICVPHIPLHIVTQLISVHDLHVIIRAFDMAVDQDVFSYPFHCDRVVEHRSLVPDDLLRILLDAGSCPLRERDMAVLYFDNASVCELGDAVVSFQRHHFIERFRAQVRLDLRAGIEILVGFFEVFFQLPDRVRNALVLLSHRSLIEGELHDIQLAEKIVAEDHHPQRGYQHQRQYYSYDFFSARIDHFPSPSPIQLFFCREDAYSYHTSQPEKNRPLGSFIPEKKNRPLGSFIPEKKNRPLGSFLP